VGLKSLKSLNLTNGYPNKNKNNNKVKSKPLELFELAGKNLSTGADDLFDLFKKFMSLKKMILDQDHL
jgi:hypothetical protein